MKLLVILLCLFSERFLIHAVSYQRFNWFNDYYQYIKGMTAKNTAFNNHWLLLAFIVLPLIFLVAIVYLLLHSMFFGFLGLLLSIVLFFYCLGPQNVFYPVTQSDTENTEQLTGKYFAMVNRQLFSVIFWYVIAGPVVMVAYRLIALCCEISEVSTQAREITDLLEWIPARLTALLFLLVGNFQHGLKFFSQHVFAKPDFNNEMLRICGTEAARTNETEVVPMVVAENLVEHALIVILVFIALFTLVSWL